MIAEEKAAQIKNVTLAATFNAWLQGAGEGKSFKHYARGLGVLDTPPPPSAEDVERATKHGLDQAAKIRAKVKARKQKIDGA